MSVAYGKPNLNFSAVIHLDKIFWRVCVCVGRDNVVAVLFVHSVMVK